MVTTLTATEFHARDDRPDWRYALGRIEASFRCGSFEGAADLARAIAGAAERADHHPDLDIRYSKVRVTLSTHSEGGVTAKDLDLARTIERIAPPQ
jgi:4a-hydroxytetrahydrobiopterin dehydratase